MLKFLLNTYNSGVVSDSVSNNSSEPSLQITGLDNIKHIFEEYGVELWTMFGFGVLIGIVLTCIYFSIKVHFYNKELDKQEEQERQEQSDE